MRNPVKYVYHILLRGYLKWLVKTERQSPVLDHFKLLPKSTEYSSLIYWMMRYCTYRDLEDGIRKVVEVYIQSDYDNPYLTEQCLSYVLIKGDNFSEILDKKQLDISSELIEFIVLQVVEKLDASNISANAILKLISRTKNADAKKLLSEKVVSMGKADHNTFKVLIRSVLEAGSKELLKILIDANDGKLIKGVYFYYYCSAVFYIYGMDGVKKYLNDVGKSYFYTKYSLFKELYKRSLFFKDEFISEFLLSLAHREQGSGYIKKQMIESIAKDSRHKQEFLDRLSDYELRESKIYRLLNDSNVDDLFSYLEEGNNLNHYPYISSFILFELFQRGGRNLPYSKAFDISLQKWSDILEPSYLNSFSSIGFNKAAWEVIKDQELAWAYMGCLDESLESWLCKYQYHKKNGNYDDAINISKRMISLTSGRLKLRNILRLAEMTEKVFGVDKAIEIVQGIMHEYFPALVFVLDRSPSIPVAERIRLLDGFDNEQFAKVDFDTFRIKKVSFLLESKQYEVLRGFIDEMKSSEKYISNVQLVRLLALTEYFVFSNYKQIINNFKRYISDPVVYIYYVQSIMNAKTFLPDLGGLMRNVESGNRDMKLLAYNYLMYTGDREAASSIFTTVIPDVVSSGAAKFSVQDISFKHYRPLVKSEDLVSIIMTNYGMSNYVEKAISSVLAQSYENFELIIVDDCSKDDDYSKLLSLVDSLSDPRVKVIRMSINGGTYRAKNYGISHASGKYVTFHDSDDVSHPDRLLIQIRDLKSSNAVANTTSCFRITDDEMVYFYRSGAIKKAPITLMVHRAVFKRVGVFKPVRVSADSEFLNRIKVICGPMSINNLPDVLYLASYHLSSLTSMGKTSLHPVLGVIGIRAEFKMAYTDWHGKIHQERQSYIPSDKIHFNVPVEIC